MPAPVRALRSQSSGCLSSPASTGSDSYRGVNTPIKGVSDTPAPKLAGRPLGPKPLLRHGSDNRLQLQAEGLSLLRRAERPLHVVFTIGGSRCGKSTTGNSLVFEESAEPSGFQTGHAFQPVTTGVDVALRPLCGGGSLVVGDCEGAFHICASEQSARGFGMLGLLAYHLSSDLLHVSMGSIDERDIEALGYLAAYAASSEGGSSGSAAGATTIGSAFGTSPSKALDLPAKPREQPALILLVNGARFDLGDAAVRRLFKPPEGASGGRWCARAAISQGFRGQPALEALPAFEHAAYWPCVEALRRRILEGSPVLLPNGLQASGCDLADKLVRLVASLNMEAADLALRAEPQPATAELYRTLHLEPLVEEIAKKFASVGAECNLDEQREAALAEFDRRSAWLARQMSQDDEEDGEEGDDAGASRGQARPGAPVCSNLVADTRLRLTARIAGISEAVERGRLQGGSSASRRWQTPVSKSSRGAGKENIAPSSSPGTPRKRNLKQLEALVAEEVGRVESTCVDAEIDVDSLEAEILAAKGKLDAHIKLSMDMLLNEDSEVLNLQERFESMLDDLAEVNHQGINELAAAAGKALATLQSELEGLLQELSDPVGACASQLNEIRTELEAERFRRHEAGNAAATALDADLKALREDLDRESSRLVDFRDTAMKRFTTMVHGLEQQLQDEHCQRQDRHMALVEVVERFSASVAATTDAEAAGRDVSMVSDTSDKELTKWSHLEPPKRSRPLSWQRPQRDRNSMEQRLRAALLRQADTASDRMLA